MVKEKRNLYFFLFFLVIVILAHIVSLSKNNFTFILNSDMNAQLVPFYMDGWEKFSKGELYSIHWNWNDFLGNDYPGATIYYYLFNPYFILSLLFSNYDIYFVMTSLNILKLTVAGILFYYYLKSLKFSKYVSLIGGIIYIFSGPLIVNYSYYFFVDLLSFFPLFLIGLEKILEEDNILTYILGLVLCVITNYYFTYFLVWFTPIYFISRLYLKYDFLEKKTMLENDKNSILVSNIWLKKISRLIIGTIIGGGLTFFVTIPSFNHIIKNPRIGTMNNELFFDFKILINNIIAIIYSFFFSPQNVVHNIILRHSLEYLQSMTYFTSLIFNFTMFQAVIVLKDDKKKRNVVFVLIGLFLLINSSPLFLSVLSHFSNITFRWSFILVTGIIILLSYILENLEKFDIKILKYNVCFTLSIFASKIVLRYLSLFYSDRIRILSIIRTDMDLESFNKYLIFNVLIQFLILIVISIYLKILKPKKLINKRIIYLCILFFVSLDGIIRFNSFYSMAVHNVEELQYFNEIHSEVEELTEKYYEKDKLNRISIGYVSGYGDYIDSNIGFRNNLMTLSTYNSLYNSNTNNLYSMLYQVNENYYSDFWRKQISISKYNSPLLSVKYYLGNINTKLPSGYELINKNNELGLFENQNFIELGFQQIYYMKEDEYYKLPWFARDYALLKSVIIHSSLEKKLGEIGMEEITADHITKELNYEICEIDESGGCYFSQNGELYYPVTEGVYIHSNNINLYRNIPSNYFPTYNSAKINAGDQIQIQTDSPKKELEIVFLPDKKNLSIRELLSFSSKPYNIKLDKDTINFSYMNHDIRQDFIVLSIPYSDNWRVNINNKNAKLIRINGGLSGIIIDSEGISEVKLEYVAESYNEAKKVSFYLAILIILISLIIKYKNRN